MRTTIRIDDSIHRRAKARAAETQQSISAFIEDAVRESLRPRRTPGIELPELPTIGGGVVAGIALTDMRSVHEAMDCDKRLDLQR